MPGQKEQGRQRKIQRKFDENTTTGRMVGEQAGGFKKTMTQGNAGKCDENPRCETKTAIQACR